MTKKSGFMAVMKIDKNANVGYAKKRGSTEKIASRETAQLKVGFRVKYCSCHVYFRAESGNCTIRLPHYPRTGFHY